ncbi:hypothetical protein AXF42_Ash008764 [Apostasia shenzhenica]|uniref:Integrator complex subunit 4/Protein SIEL C-terminal Ig-like domain-containing protein n=1 Tax=Apostasia shenzhenica TaxID=1088818 RepID=A0A2I0ASH2_9ASPA|nr:hypothetical protein AXF42_Ash008764 [Apostasia shenzhenica]
MESFLLERIKINLEDPSNTQRRFRALASAGALIAHPNSSNSAVSEIVDALFCFISRRDGDSTFLRSVVKLLGDAAAFKKTLAPSIVDLLRPILHGGDHLQADAFAALTSVEGFALDEELALSLASSPVVAVRLMLVKSLVSFLDGDKMRAVVLEPHVMIRVLLGLADDLYPFIRLTAVDGLASWCRNKDSYVSFPMVECFYDCATSLLHDADELTRLSAIRLVSACGQFFERSKEETCYSELMDAIFVQLCLMARDMDKKVRIEAFSALGKMGVASENALQQSLSRKILGTRCAFVHGLEDEFYEARLAILYYSIPSDYFILSNSEVRMAACKSMGMLSSLSVQFAAAALDLLTDMLNDYSTAVRLQTLEALYQMASNDHLIFPERHVQLFLDLLSDVSASIRYATRKLLLKMKLSKLEMFKSTLSSLLSNLEKKPEEEEDIFFVLFYIGLKHAKFATKLANQFTSEILLTGEGELSLDTPLVAGQLVLAVSSTFSNEQIIAESPTVLFSYAIPLCGRISRSLGGLISQDVLLKHLLHLNAVQSKSEERQSTSTKLQEALVNIINCNGQCSSMLPLELENSMTEFSANMLHACMVSTPLVLYHHEVRHIDDVLEQRIKLILAKVQEIWPLIQVQPQNVFNAKRMLRACMEELYVIGLDNNGCGADLVAFASEYVHVIILIAKIWEQLHSKASQVVGMNSLDILIEKLEASLRRIIFCFPGLSMEEECHVLELILLCHVFRLHKIGICSEEDKQKKKMSLVISRLELLGEGRFNLSDFIEEVKRFCTEEGEREFFRSHTIAKFLQHFDLKMVPLCAKFKHIKANLQALGNDSENPFNFISGLPVGIKFQVILHNISQTHRIWLRMVVGDSIQYVFLNVCQFGGSEDARERAATLPFYATPRAESFLLMACICMECLPDEYFFHLKKETGKPKQECTQISDEIIVYFFQSKKN